MIRVAQDKDEIPSLARIGAHSFTQTFSHLYKPEDLSMFLEENHSETAYAKMFDDPQTCIWVAEETAGDLAGYVVAGPCHLPVPNMPDNAGELARLYVLTSHQGQGLGNVLLERALDWMEEKFDHQYLSVYSENIGAQRLYARYGFEKIHDYYFMVGNHADPEFILERKRNISPGGVTR